MLSSALRTLFSRLWSATLAALMVAPLAGDAGPASRLASDRPTIQQDSKVRAAYAQLPLNFEPNAGQLDPTVKFRAHGSGYDLFLTPTQAVLALQRLDVVTSRGSDAETQIDPNGVTEHRELAASQPARAAVLQIQLVGANPDADVHGLEQLIGKSHFYLGTDQKNWRPDVPLFGRVEYREIYPGIHLVYYGTQQQLEYDFVIEPGADLNDIVLAFEGQHDIRIDPDGDLVLNTNVGEIRQQAPRVYQDVRGIRHEVVGNYVIKGANQVGFRLSAYDPHTPLVIDPVLTYSTYLGGSGDDGNLFDMGVDVDADGNMYVAGRTVSVDFPVANAQQALLSGGSDVFITKLDPTGQNLIYSTFIGGPANEVEFFTGLAVDAAGNAYVTGHTSSLSFPTTVGVVQPAYRGGSEDGFVLKLDASGSLVYSTYLGGNSGDRGFSVAVDGSGQAFITGETLSPNFPTTPGAFQVPRPGGQDAFVTKLSPNGSTFVYSTYLGGTGADRGQDIAVDSAGNAHVTGIVFTSTNFPTSSEAFQRTFGGGSGDAFVTKLNAAGSALMYSTYLGGSAFDTGDGIALDPLGNATVVGSTASPDFPTEAALQGNYGGGANDVFVTKLSSAGSALVFSTYLGGDFNDFSPDLAIDPVGSLYITGVTFSTDFPTTPDAFQPNPAPAPGADAFVTKIDGAGSALLFSTYVTGTGEDRGFAIAEDRHGHVVVAGSTTSFDLLTANPFQPAKMGGRDAFLIKISDPLKTESLVEVIEDLVEARRLKSGQANGLLKPLQNAVQSLAEGHIAAACSQLDDFETEVRKKIRDGALRAADGAALVEAAEGIRTGFEC
jgi:beta-propeller repeat-containing protein/FIMAH domain-containing protein